MTLCCRRTYRNLLEANDPGELAELEIEFHGTVLTFRKIHHITVSTIYLVKNILGSTVSDYVGGTQSTVMQCN